MNGGEIVAIEQNSIAERAGLKVGDRLITINGEAILDLLDFMTAIYETKLHLTILRDGVPIELKIRKKNYESLGVTFSGVIFDKLKICHNNCQFCFVMQDPPSARETMKIKDDDYRLSFMSGNFISMTNLKESDWEKIIAYHLSPL